MRTEVDRVLEEITEEYLRTGNVAVAEWVRRYPQYRAEILEYRLDMECAPTALEIEAERGPWPDVGAARGALTRHGQAISLGDAWLQDAVADEDAEGRVVDPDAELARELARIRSTECVQQGKASRSFRKAVVIAWGVQRLATRNRRATRFTMAKVCYLLEHAMELGVFQQHTRQRWGPYDAASRYRDAEPITLRKGYLIIRGTTFEPGPNIDQVEKYASDYLYDSKVAGRLLDRLSQLTDSELETWATVHWVVADLTEAGMPFGSEAIRSYLAREPVWLPKLGQQNFRVDRIEAAITGLQRLGLLPGVTGDG